MFCNYFKFKQLVFASLFASLYSCKDLEISREKSSYENKQYDLKVRSFVPFDIFGLGANTRLLKTKRFNEVTWKNANGLFLGDRYNREFSTNDNKNSRVYYLTRIDIEKNTIGHKALVSDFSKVRNGRIEKTAGKIEFKYIRNPKIENGLYNGEKILKFYSHLKGKNSSLPSSDYFISYIDIFLDFEIIENIEDRYIKIKGKITGDNFPSREIYITDKSGKSVFIGVFKYEDKSISLFKECEGDNPIDFDFKIKTDKLGNFVEVIENGSTYSISYWNNKFINKGIH